MIQETVVREQVDQPDRLDRLKRAVEHAAHLLPAQGPITAFVHHNTLHALDDLPFDEAVKQGEKTFGCLPYLPEGRYRELLARGRIRESDLHDALIEDLGEHADALLGYLGTRFHLHLAMLQYPLRLGPSAELRWVVAETDALRRFREDAPAHVRTGVIEETRHWIMRDLRNGEEDCERPGHDRQLRETVKGLLRLFGESSIEHWNDAAWEAFCLHLLWRVCYQGVAEVPTSQDSADLLRHRDLLLAAAGEDSDQLVDEILIRMCAAFLDQGFANWSVPQREQGFYRAFFAVYRQPGEPLERWLRGLKRELDRLAAASMSPLESVEESLGLLGVRQDEWEPFISETLLALRGWAGMIWQTETRGDRVAHPAPPGSLVEFLAIRLILDRLALKHVAKESLGFDGSLSDLRRVARTKIPHRESDGMEQRAFLVFQLAQVLGWRPEDLYRLSKGEWTTLVQEMEAFSDLERRRIFHQAFERKYRAETLDAVATHDRRRWSLAKINPSAATEQSQEESRTSTTDSGNRKEERPAFQVVCCIDEREESFRRHLEEVAPECETLGAAGFYGVAMYYRGAADAHFVPLCPVVIRPEHYVQEYVVYTFEDSHRRRKKTRRVLGMASHRAHVGSRTFAGGAVAGFVGSLATVPLVARVLFPRLTAQIRRLFGSLVQPPPVTDLQLERTAPHPGSGEGQIGYTVDEMAGIVERLLRDIGLTSNFSRLVVVTGHGSSSLNNPHESAHDCGACAGARGGPNARAFARMANDPRVRDLVARQRLVIPKETLFVGAYHNTCDDSVVYFDLDRLPTSHKADFEAAKRALDHARERDAHERCRRFESAPLKLSTEAALRHVEGRAADLAQVRPEYGHATNSLCFVGRRWRNRGLFLDRRAFLTSYDPTQDDDDCTILTRILQAVIPVCAGISLEYYFSFTDPTGWGCGTKLPHNIASLLGVMNGAASDLRPGLPWQMVEIHEPVRLMFIIETTPEAMLQIMDRNEAIGKLCRNEWVQLATLDPQSSTIHVFRKGQFELYGPTARQLPEVDSSLAWYRGWRDHLGFASVRECAPSEREEAQPG